MSCVCVHAVRCSPLWLLVSQVQGAAGAEGGSGNSSSSQQQQVPSVFMSPPFTPSMLDPIVAMFSPHRAQQQKEAKNKVSYAAASRTRLQVIR